MYYSTNFKLYKVLENDHFNQGVGVITIETIFPKEYVIKKIENMDKLLNDGSSRAVAFGDTAVNILNVPADGTTTYIDNKKDYHHHQPPVVDDGDNGTVDNNGDGSSNGTVDNNGDGSSNGNKKNSSNGTKKRRWSYGIDTEKDGTSNGNNIKNDSNDDGMIFGLSTTVVVIIIGVGVTVLLLLVCLMCKK
eukprot:GHVR01041963.1.p2 GENE.GHVR01041963.1~~GHVR01041963.1.p2  ORF type:complete len:191 (-),score=59.95 GHVR01041963.1:1223-1795(-)